MDIGGFLFRVDKETSSDERLVFRLIRIQYVANRKTLKEFEGLDLKEVKLGGRFFVRDNTGSIVLLYVAEGFYDLRMSTQRMSEELGKEMIIQMSFE